MANVNKTEVDLIEKIIDGFTFRYYKMTSTQAIEVYAFAKSYSDSKGDSGGTGDPYLSIVPPLAQYINSMVYGTMEGQFEPFKFYAAVVYPTAKLQVNIDQDMFRNTRLPVHFF